MHVGAFCMNYNALRFCIHCLLQPHLTGFFFFFLLILVCDKQMHKGVLVFFLYVHNVLIEWLYLYNWPTYTCVHECISFTCMPVLPHCQLHISNATNLSAHGAWAFIQTCFVSLADTHSTQPSLIHVGATVMTAYGIMHYLHTLP